MRSATQPDDPLADLTAQCIVAFEREGEEAVDDLLQHHAELAEAVRSQLATLRDAGLLVVPRRPECIGRYRVRKLLGNGGMGSVWLCEQDEPIHRRVAVKLIRAGMNQGDVLRRFHLEQQTLAMLEHPNIARVHDAGSTDDGQPFLVMEYVAGLPLSRYCDERQLDLHDRLQLFLQVCDAVQHAHQKGILHRDLKPSNVLVTDRDGAAFPIVIDFGVAKAVGGALASGTMLTLPGRLVGTPEYMSPEQATSEHDVDTRTDVYSLGVMLYELLTGTLPIDSVKLHQAPDLARALRETDPPTPSTRLTHLGDAARRIAENRRSDLQALTRNLRGDLDWIVLKALERDRNRRYGMVGELAADLRRHLRDEPVQAARPSRWYVAKKFCRRHRLQVTAGVAVLVALGSGLVVSTVFYRDAATAERAALGLAARLHSSLDTTLTALDRIVTLGADGLQALPQSGPLRAQLLEQALELHERLIAAGDTDDPRLASSLASALASAANLQFLLGRQEQSLSLLVRAEQTLAGCSDTDAVEVAVRCQLARACQLCGELRYRRGEPAESRVHLERALAIYDLVLAKAPERRDARLGRLQALRDLSDRATATDVERARILLREALPLAERFLGESGVTRDERLASLRVWIRLGWLEGETGHQEAALALTRRAHEHLHRTLPAAADPVERLELARLLPALSNSEVRFGDYDAARTSSRLAIAELRPAIAAHPEIVSYCTDLSAALFQLATLQGDREPYPEIDRLQREALQLEDDSYERSGRSPERGDRYLGLLLGYASDRVDMLLDGDPSMAQIDRAFLQHCVQRATSIHESLPPAFLRDRHTRESWSQSYKARAGMLQIGGDLAGARSVLAEGRNAMRELQQDHPDVVQAHRLAAQFAFLQARLEHQDGALTATWQFALQGHDELAKALRVERVRDAHWRRIKPDLRMIAGLLAGKPAPASLTGAQLADFAADYAAGAEVARQQGTPDADALLAFGRGLFTQASQRGLAPERLQAPEFDVFRR